MVREAVEHWARQLSNYRVAIFTDNIATVIMGNKGTSTNPVVMQTLRTIGYLTLKYDFNVELFYIPGKHKTLLMPYPECISLGILIDSFAYFGKWDMNHMDTGCVDTRQLKHVNSSTHR